MIKLRKVMLEEKTILANLLNLYLHDLSASTDDLWINEEGEFEYDSLDLFFEDEKLEPLFILKDEKIIGFILLAQRPYILKGTDYGVQELFIVRYERRKGYAEDALKELFKLYPGKYYVVVLNQNKVALSFWDSFINANEYQYEMDDDLYHENCIFYTFSS